VYNLFEGCTINAFFSPDRSSCGSCAISAPLLKYACPEQLHERILISLASPRRLYLRRLVLLNHRLLLSLQLLFPLRRRSAPPQYPIPALSQPDGHPGCSLFNLPSGNLIEGLAVYLLWCPFDLETQLSSCSRILYSPFAPVPYAIAAFRASPQSFLIRTSFRAFWWDIVFLLYLTLLSCTAGNPSSGCGHFLPRSTISVGPRFPEDVPLPPCHCCTAGRLPAGDSQLLPGSTISSGQLLQLSMLPCSLLPAPRLLGAMPQYIKPFQPTVISVNQPDRLGGGLISGHFSVWSVWYSITDLLSDVFLLPAGRHNGPERFPGRSGHHEGDEAPKLGTAVGYVLYTLVELLAVCTSTDLLRPWSSSK
jgi:hypothetical protein